MPKDTEYRFWPNMYFPYYLVVSFPEIEPDCRKQWVVVVTDATFQEVAHHAVVVLDVAYHGLYCRPGPETLPGLALLVIGPVLRVRPPGPL